MPSLESSHHRPSSRGFTKSSDHHSPQDDDNEDLNNIESATKNSQKGILKRSLFTTPSKFREMQSIQKTGSHHSSSSNNSNMTDRTSNKQQQQQQAQRSFEHDEGYHHQYHPPQGQEEQRYTSPHGGYYNRAPPPPPYRESGYSPYYSYETGQYNGYEEHPSRGAYPPPPPPPVTSSGRNEEGHAIVTPPKTSSSMPPPPQSSSVTNSPYSQQRSIPPTPASKNYTHSPPDASHSPNYDAPPSYHHAPPRRYDHYEHYEGQYGPPPPAPTGSNEVTSPSSTYSRSSHYYDRAKEARHAYDQRDRYYSSGYPPPPPPPPSGERWAHPPPPPRGGYHAPPQYNDGYYEENYDYNYDGYRASYPPPREYDVSSPRAAEDQHPVSPGATTPSSSRGTNHKATFNLMMEDTTRPPRMPSAASEVDFDVMKPPVTPITQPSSSPLRISPDTLKTYDVLLGRGGGTNSQIGNRHFRSLVQDFQPIYLTMKRKDKPLMARSLVLIVRQRGGRFLKKGDEIGEYYEVGDEKAEAKASQALREGLEVRATTRKRKEICLMHRENEMERKRVCSGYAGEGQGREEGRCPSPETNQGYYHGGSGGGYEYFRNGPEERNYKRYDGYDDSYYAQQQQPGEYGEARNEERRIRGGGGDRDSRYGHYPSTEPPPPRQFYHPSTTQPPSTTRATPSKEEAEDESQNLTQVVSRDDDYHHSQDHVTAEKCQRREEEGKNGHVHVVPV